VAPFYIKRYHAPTIVMVRASHMALYSIPDLIGPVHLTKMLWSNGCTSLESLL
jgi:hypothetical protein